MSWCDDRTTSIIVLLLLAPKNVIIFVIATLVWLVWRVAAAIARRLRR